MAIIEYPNYNESLVSLASSILSFYGEWTILDIHRFLKSILCWLKRNLAT